MENRKKTFRYILGLHKPSKLDRDYKEFRKAFMPGQAGIIFWSTIVLMFYSALGYLFFKKPFLLSSMHYKQEYAMLFVFSAVIWGAGCYGLRSKKLSQNQEHWLNYFEIVTFTGTLLYITWSHYCLYNSISVYSSANLMISLISYSVCCSLFNFRPKYSGLVLLYWVIGNIVIVRYSHKYIPKLTDLNSVIVFGIVIVAMYTVKYYSGARMNKARNLAQKTIKEYNERLEEEVRRKTERIELVNDTLILAMADMVESRDLNTGGHIKRTSEVVRILADEMKKDPKYADMDDFFSKVIKAAPMHDLGKIAVDDVILRKPGKFTNEEFSVMKTHAEKGSGIVEKILSDFDDDDFRKIASNVAHFHHERLDGSGYPDHLKGESIPFEARIMAVADVYDALVSKRCYKDSFSFEDARRIIIEGMGTQFDPDLEKYFEAVRPALEKFYSEAFADEKEQVCQ